MFLICIDVFLLSMIKFEKEKFFLKPSEVINADRKLFLPARGQCCSAVPQERKSPLPPASPSVIILSSCFLLIAPFPLPQSHLKRTDLVA